MNHRKNLGISARMRILRASQEAPVVPRSRQEAPGAARGRQEAPGGTRGRQGPPGAAKGGQEAPGTTRGRQGAPGGTRGCQGPPGAAGGTQGHTEAPSQPRGAARKRKEAPGSPKCTLTSDPLDKNNVIWTSASKKRTGQLPQQLSRPLGSDFNNFEHLDKLFLEKERFWHQKRDAIKQLKK